MNTSLKSALILQTLHQICLLADAQNLQLNVYADIDSTHLTLLKHLSSGVLTSPQALLAEFQTAGIGQNHRNWYGEAYANVYLSYACRLHPTPTRLEGLSLALGLSMAQTLEKQGIEEVKVKWSNDIYVQNRKLAGILINLETLSDGNIYAVISVGMNVNMLQDNPQIDQPWISLRQITGEFHDRNLLAAQLLASIITTIDIFCNHGFTAFMDHWSNYDALKNKMVLLINPQQTVKGVAVGVNVRGQLLIQQADGTIHGYHGGTVRLLSH